MLLQMGEFEYNSICYALEYAIRDLEAHNKNIYLDTQKKDLEETLRYIKDFWNADQDQ